MTSITQSLSTKTKVASLALAVAAAALMTVCLTPGKAYAPAGGGSSIFVGYNSDGGQKPSVNPETNVTTGELVTVTATPNSEYKVTSVVAVDDNSKSVTVTKVSDNVYTFEMSDTDVTVTVTYAKITWDVTFDAKGGSPTPDAQTVAYGGKVTKPADPTKEGKVFDGWFQDIGGGMGVAWNFDSDTVASNITLIATWKDAPAADDASDSSTDATVAATGDNTPLMIGGVALVVAVAGLVIAVRKLSRKGL